MGEVDDLFPYREHFQRDAADVAVELNTILGLLEKWQRIQNLVSRETLDESWTRHVLDSLQLLPRLPGTEAVDCWIDLGSGGGFPALPLAVALKSRQVSFHLVEANSRKCAFLRAVVRELGLRATIHQKRLESLENLGPADILTARALAPLPQLFPALHRFWGAKTRALLHKGREYGEEIAQVDSAWIANVVKHASKTDPDGVILEVTDLAPRSAR